MPQYALQLSELADAPWTIIATALSHQYSWYM